jgi:hypothetical protein
MSLITSLAPTYAIGSKICDEDREWVCRSKTHCKLSPYASYFDQLNAWEITAAEATVTKTAATYAMGKPDSLFCTEKNIEVPTDLSTLLTLVTGTKVENG